MPGLTEVISCFLLFINESFVQSMSYQSFMNPLIHRNRPGCKITKIRNYYYLAESSFYVTPVIYHSSDLVQKETITQPVSLSCLKYGDCQFFLIK
jgi:beta-xylosidase